MITFATCWLPSDARKMILILLSYQQPLSYLPSTYHATLIWSEALASRQKHQTPSPTPLIYHPYAIKQPPLPLSVTKSLFAKDVQTEQFAGGGLARPEGVCQTLQCPAAWSARNVCLKPDRHPAHRTVLLIISLFSFLAITSPISLKSLVITATTRNHGLPQEEDEGVAR
jgi:hypothetical protein